jgi:hypothetical protein
VQTGKELSIAYYISAHGYGHGVRSCQIIRAINKMHPQLSVHIVSTLPASFLSNQIDTLHNPVRGKSLDIGMVQVDSIRVDVKATLAKIRRLYSRRQESVKDEALYLKENNIRLVVVDIPALPIEAAALVGIPRLAVGNFGWDWIYSGFLSRDARWQPIIDTLREQYAKTDLLLRLPFCEAMDAFPRIEDIPLVASPGRCRRAQIAEHACCDPAKKWILLSFTTLEWNGNALNRVEKIKDYEFFTLSPLVWHRRNIHSLNREQFSFSDVIASMDAVVSKPGFGILSDCIVNRKPLIYAERSDFLEFEILEAAIRKYLRHVHIPAVDLYRGELRPSLDLIWNCPDPEARMLQGGDRIAAQRIAQLL